jgi:putative flippase GtrA
MLLREIGYVSRFLQVGAVGFAIDASLLWMLIYTFEMSPIVSRLFSFLVTMAVTFVLNARYTFTVRLRDSSKSRYGLVQIFGASINFASYSALVLYVATPPLLALAISSVLSSVHNFAMMRRFVFNISDKPPT